MRKSVLALAVAIACLAGQLGLGSSAASSGKIRKVCARATLIGSTGSKHGRISRGDKVVLARRDSRHHRSYVIARNGQGWVPASALCKRGR